MARGGLWFSDVVIDSGKPIVCKDFFRVVAPVSLTAFNSNVGKRGFVSAEGERKLRCAVLAQQKACLERVARVEEEFLASGDVGRAGDLGDDGGRGADAGFREGRDGKGCAEDAFDGDGLVERQFAFGVEDGGASADAGAGGGAVNFAVGPRAEGT